MNLAKLVEKMIRIEKGEVLRKNEADLFHTKQDLGEFDDFEKSISEIPIMVWASVPKHTHPITFTFVYSAF